MDNVVSIAKSQAEANKFNQKVDKPKVEMTKSEIKLNEAQEKQFRAHLDQFTMAYVKFSTLQQIDFLFNLTTRVDMLQMDNVELRQEVQKMRETLKKMT